MSNKFIGNKIYEQGYSTISLIQKNIDEIFIKTEKTVITLKNEQELKSYMQDKTEDERRTYLLEQQMSKLKNEVLNNLNSTKGALLR